MPLVVLAGDCHGDADVVDLPSAMQPLAQNQEVTSFCCPGETKFLALGLQQATGILLKSSSS